MLPMHLFGFRLPLIALLPVTLATAQTPVPTQPDLGEATFQRICAVCHTTLTSRASPKSDTAPDEMVTRAPPREILRQLPPEVILAALTTGKMQAQGSALNDAEQHAVAEYASGSRFGASSYGAPGTEKPNSCKDPAPLTATQATPAWNGWGNDLANRRFQSRQVGGLTAADLPKLHLKWAFGYTNTVQLKAQPVVFGHRVFVASEPGQIYALDARTGCTYWTFKAEAPVGATPSVASYKTPAGKNGFALYIGDRNATVYALDAQDGTLLWKRRVDDHKVAGITGAPSLYDGRLYVPVQGVGEEIIGSTNNYACCTFRGSVVALNINTGDLLWKTYTVAKPELRGKNAAGVEIFGPSGGGIWSSPTIDVHRGVLYVGTGNGYSDPPQPGTDAIIAMDLKTGAVRWMRQVAGPDNWAMGCPPKSPNNPTCPRELGPDYDFSGSPALVQANGRDLLIAPQKSGMVYAFDPDKQGAIVWQYRFGKGSGLGGQWGIAVDGSRFYVGQADLLTPSPGGMHALSVADGKPIWDQPPPPKLCLKTPGQACSSGQGSAPTAIPGAVLSSDLDGGVRAYSSTDGSIIWTYDTNRDFTTVNGVTARGGGMDHGGPVVVDGMVYVNSGYGGFIAHPGNVLLAFGVQ